MFRKYVLFPGVHSYIRIYFTDYSYYSTSTPKCGPRPNESIGKVFFSSFNDIATTFHIEVLDHNPAHMTMDIGSDSDPELHETQFSVKQTLNRSLHSLFEELLSNKRLPEQIPINFCELEHSEEYVSESMSKIQNWHYESKDINETHIKIWPHLMAMKSLIFVGNVEFLPELVYLKPICWLIKVNIYVNFN